jgi:predicted short-subunit dehydrogenase-like oxidoreductase (DUF2520 family)
MFISKFAASLIMEALQDIVIVGAGNVGTHLAEKMREAGFTICQLAERGEAIVPGKDLYIMALPDAAMEEALTEMPLKDELLVHTSGSVPMEILNKYSENTGVFYPLQTFTKGRSIDMNKVPLLIEANRIDNENKLVEVARKLSNKVIVADSDRRLSLHIAAVFASNFSNHMYDIARRLMEEQELDYDLLSPLIMETAAKATALGPDKAQTGPAKRNDHEVIRKHLDMLKGHEAIKELYKRISDNISDQEK